MKKTMHHRKKKNTQKKKKNLESLCTSLYGTKFMSPKSNNEIFSSNF